MNPGVYPSISNEQYHAQEGLSCSGLKRLRKSPYHFHKLSQRPPSDPTPQMLNGTLVHCALLEPREFAKRYMTIPEDAPRRPTKAQWAAKKPSADSVSAMKWWGEFEAQANGAVLITADERAAAMRQAEALSGVPEVENLLANCQTEVSAYWIDPATGVLCKCRPDVQSYVEYGDGVVLMDVKTTDDASDEGFKRAVARYCYHMQADWYCTGFEIASGLQVHGMVFAVVESEYPHACATYMLSDAAIVRGRKENRAALTRYAHCITTNEWPGYPSGIQVIDLPPWE